MSMEDLMRAFAKHASEEAEPKPPALIAEALRDQAQFYTRTNPFKVGDIVTPRAGTDMKGVGDPLVVVAVNDDPRFVFIGEPSSNSFGQRLDIRVLRWVRGRFACHWVESATFEPWVEPAAKGQDAPAADQTSVEARVSAVEAA